MALNHPIESPYELSIDLKVGELLIPYFDHEQQGFLMKSGIQSMRNIMEKTIGIRLPLIHITDFNDFNAPDNLYQLKINDKTIRNEFVQLSAVEENEPFDIISCILEQVQESIYTYLHTC